MYYAVKVGRIPGIYDNWQECKDQIYAFSGAIYKKFETIEEANIFIETDQIISVFKPGDIIFDYYVYTDGSCIGMRKNEPRAAFGIYFGYGNEKNTCGPVPGKQSNNTGELYAIYVLFGLVKDDILVGKKICIVTDSKYVILCMTSYGDKCKKLNWSDVPNVDLVKEIYTLYREFIDINIFLRHIHGHREESDIHTVGNREADKLAVSVYS